MTDEERYFLSHVPEDGTGIGIERLRRQLSWEPTRFEAVRASLIDKGVLVPGPGRGGSVRRASAADEENTLIQKLEDLGGSAGNTVLMRELGWTPDRYYRVRDRLVDAGRLMRGPGRGGTVRSVFREAAAPIDAPPPTTLEQGEQRPPREEDLYAHVERVLRENWAKDLGFAWFHVSVTARQGRRPTGGRWTRPDITVLSLKRYRYLPGVNMEVWSFEVKSLEGLDVSSVYEAVAHTRFTTRAYLIFPFPEKPNEAQAALLEDLQAEAARHGIGLITMVDPADYGSWEERVKPSRSNAEPERINEFIAQQFSPDAQSELQDRLRGT